MEKKYKIIISVIALIIISGGAFYGGMIYGKNQAVSATTSARANFTGRTGRTGGAPSGSGAGFTTGTIISKDNSSITLQLPAAIGGSKIIFYSDATQINKMTSGTPTDLTNGTSVSITGTPNPDGSVTAQSIQIRPANTNSGQNGPAGVQ